MEFVKNDLPANYRIRIIRSCVEEGSASDRVRAIELVVSQVQEVDVTCVNRYFIDLPEVWSSLFQKYPGKFIKVNKKDLLNQLTNDSKTLENCFKDIQIITQFCQERDNVVKKALEIMHS